VGSRATSVGRSVARFDHNLGKFFSAGARERSEASIGRSIGRADGSDAGATRRRAADARVVATDRAIAARDDDYRDERTNGGE